MGIFFEGVTSRSIQFQGGKSPRAEFPNGDGWPEMRLAGPSLTFKKLLTVRGHLPPQAVWSVGQPAPVLDESVFDFTARGNPTGR